MDEIGTLLALRAASTGRAQRKTLLRHVHLIDEPFAIVAYHLAGDEGAPLAFMFGTSPGAAALVVVPEPRNRELRFAALASFGEALNSYLEASTDGPQLLFANDATANWLLDLVGSYTRYVTNNGNRPAPESIGRAGKNMSYLYELMTVPASSIVLRATDFLSAHFQTGQLGTEDLNLGAQLAWITASGEMTASEAALAAEQSAPAGPLSDPEWDARFLENFMTDWRRSRRAADPDSRQRVLRAHLEEEARAQLLSGWTWMWQAREVLQALSPAPYVTTRFTEDLDKWTEHVERMQRDEARFAARPDARYTAARLRHHEHQAELAEARGVGSDPLILARIAVKGEVVDGQVLAADLTATQGRSSRPVLEVQPEAPCTLAPGSKVFLTRTMRVTMEIGPARRSPMDPVTLTVLSGANIPRTRALLPRVGERLVASSRGLPRDPFVSMGAGVPWTHALPETA